MCFLRVFHTLSLDISVFYFKRQSTLNLPFFPEKVTEVTVFVRNCRTNLAGCPPEYHIGIRTISEFRNLGFRLARLV